MKIIEITESQAGYPESIEGTRDWYVCSQGMNFCDLYEAEEMIRQGNAFSGVTWMLLHFPEGRAYIPFPLKENVYVERPVYENGMFFYEKVDFTRKKIGIYQFEPSQEKLELIDEIGLDEVKDCYNLKLEVTPLMLGRSGNDGYYEVIWPEKRTIPIGARETVCFRDGEKLYCSEWEEDPEYHEYVIVRDIATGEILSREEGCVCRMPDQILWKIGEGAEK